MFSSQPDKIREEIDRVMDDENKILLIFTNPMTAAQKRMTMKRYEALREKVNGVLEFYIKNNIQYKSLNESGVIAKMSQISDEEVNEMTIVHAVEEPEAAAEVTSDQSNVRRPVVFEEAANEYEELLIHQERVLYTSNEAIELVTTLKNGKCEGYRCTADGQFCSIQ